MYAIHINFYKENFLERLKRKKIIVVKFRHNNLVGDTVYISLDKLLFEN